MSQQPPHVVALLDQADAMFGAEVDNLRAAIALGAAGVGRQQAKADFAAMFNQSDNYNRCILSSLLAEAIVRLAEGSTS